MAIHVHLHPVKTKDASAEELLELRKIIKTLELGEGEYRRISVLPPPKFQSALQELRTRLRSYQKDAVKEMRLSAIMQKIRNGEWEAMQDLVPGRYAELRDTSTNRRFTVAVRDAINHLGEKQYSTYAAWRAACKAANPSVVFEGDKDICNAKPGVGEWDGETGVVYKSTK